MKNVDEVELIPIQAKIEKLYIPAQTDTEWFYEL